MMKRGNVPRKPKAITRLNDQIVDGIYYHTYTDGIRTFWVVVGEIE
jgi:hypothetical protein